MKAKLSLVLSALLMAGCLDVKDNDANQELASAVKAQNEILKEQNKSSLKIIGTLENVSAEGTLNGAKVALKVGSEVFSATVINADGSFFIENVPFGSDYQLHITSSENSFYNSIVYGTTRSQQSNAITQNIGNLYLSKSITKEVKVVDFDTKESISGLTFYSYVHSIRSDREGDVDGYVVQSYASTYSEETGMYSITLPEDSYNSIRVSLDLDNDKKDDFEPLSSAFNRVFNPNLTYSYTISNVNLLEQETVFLKKANLNADKNLTVRISLIDKNLGSLLEAPLAIMNEDDRSFDLVYDTENNQYVADVSYKSSIDILLPSFTKDDITFESNSAMISRSNDALQVSTDGINQSGNLQYNHYNLDLDASVVDIVLAVREIDPQTPIQVIAASPVNESTYAYNVFYSQPISLLDGNIFIVQKGKIDVTFGNDSNTDFWIDGSTLIKKIDMGTFVDSTLSLNGTKLTLTPKSALEKGYNYEYQIGKINDVNNETDADVSNDDSRDFAVAIDIPTLFDINSLILDNNNYMNNGTPIVTVNTASVAAPVSNSSQTVSLILPTQLDKIFENFTLKRVSYTRDGISNISVEKYTIVSKGQAYLAGATHFLKLASNEDVIYENISSGSFKHGTSLDNGQYITFNPSYYSFNDHTAGNENSMTFEYNYELKSGEVASGTLKLLVQ